MILFENSVDAPFVDQIIITTFANFLDISEYEAEIFTDYALCLQDIQPDTWGCQVVCLFVF